MAAVVATPQPLVVLVEAVAVVLATAAVLVRVQLIKVLLVVLIEVAVVVLPKREAQTVLVRAVTVKLQVWTALHEAVAVEAATIQV